MKKVEFELDVTKNIFSEIILGIIRFFVVPINLFPKYFKKFEIKKTSIFYIFSYVSRACFKTNKNNIFNSQIAFY